MSAMRENATWAPEMAAKAAAAPPAPLPKVRRASQATAGMVSVPETIETRIAGRSPAPSTKYASPTRNGKPGRSVGDHRRVEVQNPVAGEDPEAGSGVDSFVKVHQAQAADGPEAEQRADQSEGDHDQDLAACGMNPVAAGLASCQRF